MLDSFDRAPKAELHLHLEGAIPPKTLWQLVAGYGGDATVPNPTALLDALQYTSFEHFIDTWSWMTGFVRAYEDFELIGEQVARSLAAQRIIYAEATFSPTDFARHGLDPRDIAIAIRRGLTKVDGIQVVLNCDLVRDTGPEQAERTLAMVLEVAAAADIRGITIGGSEQAFPPEQFGNVYRTAAAAGLRLTAHAGEAAGSASVRGALDTLGVERLGHGIRVVEDEELLRRVIAEQIPLEVCPTSNISTGVVSDWAEHPIGMLLARGAFVTINSDDPTFFHTSLAAELRTVAERYGALPRDLTQRAIAASWMTTAERAAATAAVDTWWSEQRQ